MRRPIALGIAAAALALAAGGFTWSLFCGMQQTEAVQPGEPEGEARCVSAPNVLLLLLAVGSAATAGGVWWTNRVVAWLAATLTLILGLAGGLSLGFWGIAVGGLAVAAAAVAPPARAAEGT